MRNISVSLECDFCESDEIPYNRAINLGPLTLSLFIFQPFPRANANNFVSLSSAAELGVRRCGTWLRMPFVAPSEAQLTKGNTTSARTLLSRGRLVWRADYKHIIVQDSSAWRPPWITTPLLCRCIISSINRSTSIYFFTNLKEFCVSPYSFRTAMQLAICSQLPCRQVVLRATDCRYTCIWVRISTWTRSGPLFGYSLVRLFGLEFTRPEKFVF